MYIYSVTLQRPTALTHAIAGNFSQKQLSEIVASHGKDLVLYRSDMTGTLRVICVLELFSVVRSISPLRLHGANFDYILLGTDSGAISVLQYDDEKRKFIKLYEEVFGRSGLRRAIPGQYLAADPEGRACMLAAVEKQKLVYVFNRDGANKLTISSPLEAHKSRTITISLTGLDVNLENPVFAAIEVDYGEVMAADDISDVPERSLVYYELDLGLNHVLRKTIGKVDGTANMLFPVPLGAKGPGGVVVCSENFVTYYPGPSFYSTKKRRTKSKETLEMRCYFPRRMNMPEETGLLVTKYVTIVRKGILFFVLASEYGDLYKLTLESDSDKVKDISIKYFDTVENPSTMTFLKNGTLFVTSENGAAHALYQFTSLGDNESVSCSASDDPMETEDGVDPRHRFFMPTKMRNLEEVSKLQNFAPVIDFSIDEESKSLLALSGKGAKNASLNVIQYGIHVMEMASSMLPGRPSSVFTLKLNATDEFDSYIVISFENATICLSIGTTVNEIPSSESGLIGDASTIGVALMGEDSIVQVHPGGTRQIKRTEEGNRYIEWKPSGKKTVSHASFNDSQLVLALHGGELVYFELTADGELTEINRKDMEVEISALAIEPLREGRIRSHLVAVGTWDNNVKILSLNSDNIFEIMAVQGLPGADAESVELMYLNSLEDADDADTGEKAETRGMTRLYLHIGLSNGVMMRNTVDELSGALSDQRLRVLGNLPVHMRQIALGGGARGLLAFSNQSWLEYQHEGRIHVTALSYVPLTAAAPFVSEQCPENGVVVISGASDAAGGDTAGGDNASAFLRIFAIPTESLGTAFHEVKIPLRYTPRRLVSHKATRLLAIIESENERISRDSRQALFEKISAEKLKDVDMSVDFLQPDEMDWVNAGPAKWASCVRILKRESAVENPSEIFRQLDIQEFDENEAAVSVCFAEFATTHGPNPQAPPSHVQNQNQNGNLYQQGGQRLQTMLCVGTVDALDVGKQQCKQGYIRTYRLGEEGQLEEEHRTPVDGIPQSMEPFLHMLLVGVGSELRLYSYGKKKLLKKCVNRQLSSPIHKIMSMGDRIYISTVTQSVYFMKYRTLENFFVPFASDVPPRAVSALALLDYESVFGADKFGNIFSLRCPSDVSENADKDVSGVSADNVSLSPNTNGKLEVLCNFHIGESINAVRKGALTPGCDAVIYVSVSGSIGAFIPITSREELDFFIHLEMHLRDSYREEVNGRDHMSFRSSYFPVKNTIDGDLCEFFLTLDKAKQREIAEGMDKPVSEICKKIEEMRFRV